MAAILGNTRINGFDAFLVDGDPSAGGGTSAALGSLAQVSSDGALWQKTSAPDTGWEQFSFGSGSSVLAGMPGNIYENLVFYVDPLDRNSYSGSGTTVTDIMGNGTSGSLSNADVSDGGFSFDGTSNGLLSFTKDTTLDNIFSGGGTICWLMAPESEGQTAGRVVDTTQSTTTAGYVIFLNNDSNGRTFVEFLRYFSGTNGEWELETVTSKLDPTPDGTGIPPIPLGAWTFCALTYDDSATTNVPTIYVQDFAMTSANSGIVTVATPTGTADSDAGNDLDIGNRSNLGRDFDGLIGPFLMFDRELDESEIHIIYNTFASRYGTLSKGQNSSTANGQQVIVKAGDATGTGADDNAGDVIIEAGQNTATSAGPGGDLVVAAGDKTGGSSGPGGEATLRAGSATTGTGLGGDLNLLAGTSSGAGGGDVVIRSGTGTDIDSDGEVQISSHSGFDQGQIRIKTGGIQTTNATPTTLATAYTLSSNGENVKVELYVVGQDNSVHSNIISAKIIQTFYRSGGTVTALSSHMNNSQANGSGALWGVALVISSNDIQIEVTGAFGNTVNWMAEWTVQEGGQAS